MWYPGDTRAQLYGELTLSQRAFRRLLSAPTPNTGESIGQFIGGGNPYDPARGLFRLDMITGRWPQAQTLQFVELLAAYKDTDEIDLLYHDGSCADFPFLGGMCFLKPGAWSYLAGAPSGEHPVEAAAPWRPMPDDHSPDPSTLDWTRAPMHAHTAWIEDDLLTIDLARGDLVTVSTSQLGATILEPEWVRQGLAIQCRETGEEVSVDALSPWFGPDPSGATRLARGELGPLHIGDTTSERLEALRDLMTGPPNPLRWWRLATMIDDWSKRRRDSQLGIDYALHHLKRWPDALRTAPDFWIDADPKPPGLVLVRGFKTTL